MDVRLKVIPGNEANGRSHIVVDAAIGGPAFIGTATNVPRYCCGRCGAVLIEGVHAKQFVDDSRPVEQLGEPSVKPVVFPVGSCLIHGIKIPNEQATIVSLNGPLVVTCPDCNSPNEMIAPNQLFDDQE